MSKFAVFDIDGTLFRSGLYREVVHELIRIDALNSKLLDLFADKEAHWHKRSHGSAFKEFEEAMAMAFDRELPKLRVTDFDAACNSVIEAKKDNVYVYTRDLAYKLKSDGYTLIAISGSQVELVEPFAKHYGFDIWIGQQYERGEEYFTGHAVKTHKDKDIILSQLIREHGLTLQGSIGVGDSMGDYEFLQMVERPIAFNPEEKLFEKAKAQGWKVVVERKNNIYELEMHNSQYILR
ncbi:MAG: HAD family phosphatase [bacterium]|nr:HAD family phosphatase [bacterium]